MSALLTFLLIDNDFNFIDFKIIHKAKNCSESGNETKYLEVSPTAKMCGARLTKLEDEQMLTEAVDELDDKCSDFIEKLNISEEEKEKYNSEGYYLVSALHDKIICLGNTRNYNISCYLVEKVIEKSLEILNSVVLPKLLNLKNDFLSENFLFIPEIISDIENFRPFDKYCSVPFENDWKKKYLKESISCSLTYLSSFGPDMGMFIDFTTLSGNAEEIEQLYNGFLNQHINSYVFNTFDELNQIFFDNKEDFPQLHECFKQYTEVIKKFFLDSQEARLKIIKSLKEVSPEKIDINSSKESSLLFKLNNEHDILKRLISGVESLIDKDEPIVILQ